ncbi:MAG: hypothetical protein RLZZ399_1243 [Verrucomicrobiota bacterium]|jgi:dienelactone hydrolase
MRFPLTTSICVALSLSATAQQLTPLKSPPKGIPIPSPDREELAAGAAQLQSEIESLAKPGALPTHLQERLVDVEVFSKAVSWAVSLDEFYDLKQVASARQILLEGRNRLEALRSGATPWTTATGPVVRGYRSKIDGSVQPYGVFVPEDRPASGGRMDVWLHGRSDKLTELAFVSERLRSKGMFTPPKTVVLHPYGRFCNAYKFAGETDVLEATEDAIRQYQISRDHVALRGFSMGGAGSWHLGAHHAGSWAVIAPGAGFAETAQYAKVFAAGKEPPPWWEQMLWSLYDVPGYAANLTNRPVIAYSGEIDPQKQAADMVIASVAKLGVQIPHLIGPKTGHSYHRDTLPELNRLVDEAAEKGRPQAPERVRLATFTLRYPKLDWVEVTGLEAHWKPSSVDATYQGSGKFAITTSGVTSLSLTPPTAWRPHGTQNFVLDGDSLSVPASEGALHFRKIQGHWTPTGAAGDGLPALRKRHGLQGPIDDAFMDTFVFVTPTGRSSHPAFDSWVHGELATAIEKWRVNFRGEPRVIEDRAVTPELMQSAHLVLWGDATSNRVIAQLLPQLPIQWDQSSLTVGKTRYNSANHAPILIYPNPQSPGRYIVLNSSYTFRQGSFYTNALQTPKLPDWAVVNLQTPPDTWWPGQIQDAGFFDEFWQFPKP